LSPYLGLLRRDSGPLPNYQQFVRPEIERRRLFQQQGADIRSLQQTTQEFQGRLQQLQEGETPPTGIGSRFRTDRPFFRNNARFFQSHRAPR
jgi:hypothetical protein